MTALTQPYEAAAKDGELIEYPVSGNTQCWKGGFAVLLGATGYVAPLRAPASSNSSDIFVGVFEESYDNLTGAAAFDYGAKIGFVRVRKRGSFLMGMSSAVITNNGVALYGADDNNVTATSTNAQQVGTQAEYISTTQVRVRIDLSTK